MNDVTPETIDPVDAYVGDRIRACREQARLTVEELAKTVRVTTDSIIAYETGAHRMPFSKHYAVAEALSVPSICFYDDIADTVPAAALARRTDYLQRLHARAKLRCHQRLKLK